MQTIIEYCPICRKQGIQQHLRFFHVNLNEAVYKCNGSRCLYPFRNFLYKNFTDNTVYRYERIGIESSMLTIQHQQESQIVPYTNDDVPSIALDFDENSMRGNAFTNNSSSSSSIIDDTTTSSSCSSSNDSFNTNSYENYSLDMFSLENLLSAPITGNQNNVSLNSTGDNDNDDDDDDTQTYEMDCINGIIDDICKNSNFTTADYTESDLNCTISELAKYIDGSPEKQQLFDNENVSPPAKNTTVRSLNESFQSSSIPYETQIASISKVSSTKIPNITVEILKPADNIDIQSLNLSNSNAILSKTISSTSSIIKNAPNVKNVQKKQPPRKSRTKKETPSKSCLQQMLRKNSDVTDQYKTLVDNKNNFRPLDLLHSVYSLKLDNSSSYTYNKKPPRTPTSKSSINHHNQLAAAAENCHVKEKKEINQNNLVDKQSISFNHIFKQQSASFYDNNVKNIKKLSPPVIKYEPLEKFNETDIKQNIICLTPESATKQITDIKLLHDLHATTDVKPNREIIDIKPLLQSDQQQSLLLIKKERKKCTNTNRAQTKKVSVIRTINLPDNVQIKQEQKYTYVNLNNN